VRLCTCRNRSHFFVAHTDPLDLALTTNGVCKVIEAIARDPVNPLYARVCQHFGKLVCDSSHDGHPFPVWGKTRSLQLDTCHRGPEIDWTKILFPKRWLSSGKRVRTQRPTRSGFDKRSERIDDVQAIAEGGCSGAAPARSGLARANGKIFLVPVRAGPMADVPGHWPEVDFRPRNGH
jgi:hypothetical protein